MRVELQQLNKMAGVNTFKAFDSVRFFPTCLDLEYFFHY